MPSGGARIRSGPPPNPRSGRSDKRGLSTLALPSEGCDLPAPAFPLLERIVYRWEVRGDTRIETPDEEATAEVRRREAEMWTWAWATPQAAAWQRPEYRWLLHHVALWVRTFVVCESNQAKAADKGSLHRFADQIGLTPAGLDAHGWQIATDTLADLRQAKKDEKAQAALEPALPATARERFKLVGT